jgi:hypothetical protein
MNTSESRNREMGGKELVSKKESRKSEMLAEAMSTALTETSFMVSVCLLM